MHTCARSFQSSPTLSDPMDCSPPGSSVHGIPQARILEWVAQGIFLTQESNPCFLCLLHWQVGSLPLVPPGKHSCFNTILLYLVYVKVLVSRYSNLSGLYVRFLGGICKTLEFPSDKRVCPGGSNGKRICLQCWRSGFNPWVGKIPWSRGWQATPVFLYGEFHGQRSLAGYI